MSAPRLLSRRGFLALAAGAGLASARAGEAPRDQGIGGTGARDAMLGPDDRGIGGTGFVGTIDAFGSIYVNGERIAYPDDAAVFIDGTRRSVGALRVGQSVRVAATPANGGLRTRRIEVVSEVVGRIAALSGDRMRILGQTIDLASAPRPAWLKRGLRVAVSGLRRVDGTIVASLVERRGGTVDRIAGLVERDELGLHIGDIGLRGAPASLVGTRIIVAGARRRNDFVISSIAPDAEPRGRNIDRLSIAGYATRDGANLRLSSGEVFPGAAALADAPAAGEARVVLNVRIGPNGAQSVQSVTDMRRERGERGPGRFGPGAGPGGFQQGSGPGGFAPGFNPAGAPGFTPNFAPAGGPASSSAAPGPLRSFLPSQ